MGKGNVQKAAAKREKNLKKLDSQKKGISVTKSVQKAMNIQCTFCKQAFLDNTSKTRLQEHVDTHEKAKKTFADCFPNFAE